MKTYSVATDKGTAEVKDPHRFSHYVENVRFWFVIHRPLNSVAPGWVVTHQKSGMRVCDIGYAEVVAGVCLRPAELGRCAIDKLVARVGAARVASKLREAEA